MPTPRPSTVSGEQQRGPGLATIVGDPTTATYDIVITMILPGDEVSAWSEKISAGASVKASNWSLPGPHRLLVNGEPCRGGFQVVSDRLTEVTLRIGAAGCETIQVGIKALPPG